MNKSNIPYAYDAYHQMLKKILSWDLNPMATEDIHFKDDTVKRIGNEDAYYLFELDETINFIESLENDDPEWSTENVKNESDIYNKVKTAYCYLFKSLAEAIDFDADGSKWECFLKYIDTNDMLRLYEVNKQKAKERKQ